MNQFKSHSHTSGTYLGLCQTLLLKVVIDKGRNISITRSLVRVDEIVKGEYKLSKSMIIKKNSVNFAIFSAYKSS